MLMDTSELVGHFSKVNVISSDCDNAVINQYYRNALSAVAGTVASALTAAKKAIALRYLTLT
jgi:hypothetical protein